MDAATPTNTNQPASGPAVDRPVQGGKRGRPAIASRDDVLALVTELYLDGQRVDITVVAARLGLGRATIYRWFGSREALLGEVIACQLELLVARKRAEVRRRGAAGPLGGVGRGDRGLRPSVDRGGDGAGLRPAGGPRHARLCARPPSTRLPVERRDERRPRRLRASARGLGGAPRHPDQVAQARRSPNAGRVARSGAPAKRVCG